MNSENPESDRERWLVWQAMHDGHFGQWPAPYVANTGPQSGQTIDRVAEVIALCPWVKTAADGAAAEHLFDVVEGGYVHYTRSEGDPLLDEARKCPGYTVVPHPAETRSKHEASERPPPPTFDLDCWTIGGVR